MRKANKEIKDVPSPLWTLFEEEVNINKSMLLIYFFKLLYLI